MLFENIAVPLLGVASYILCLILYFLDAKKRNPASLIWVGVSVLYVIPSLFDSGKSGYGGFEFSWLSFNSIDIVKAQAYSFCVLLLFLVMRLLLGRKVKDWRPFFDEIKESSVSNRECFFYYSIFFVLAFLIFVSYGKLASSGGGIGWVARREVLTGLDSALIGLLFKFLCGFSLFWVLSRRYFDLSAQVFLYVAAFIFLGGSRFYVVIVFLPVLVYWMSSKNIIRRFLLVTSSYFFLSIGMGVLRAMRFKTSLEDRIQLLMNPISTFSDVVANFRGEDSVRFFYYAYVSGEAYLESFFNLKYLLRTVLVFVPSVIAPFKPENFEYDMHYAGSGKIATMHPTLFGSIYADSKYLGVFWVFLIVFYVYVFPLFFRIRNKTSLIILYGVLCSSSLMLARGAIYGAIFAIVFFVLLVFFLERMGASWGRK